MYTIPGRSDRSTNATLENIDEESLRIIHEEPRPAETNDWWKGYTI